MNPFKKLFLGLAMLFSVETANAQFNINDLYAGAHIARECSAILMIFTSVPPEVSKEINEKGSLASRMFGTISSMFLREAENRVITNGESLRRVSSEMVEIGKQYERDPKSIGRKLLGCDYWFTLGLKAMTNDSLDGDAEVLNAIGVLKPIAPDYHVPQDTLAGLQVAFRYWEEAGKPTPASLQEKILNTVIKNLGKEKVEQAIGRKLD